MQRIKNASQLFWGIIIHAGILWASLSLGYNSYKEYMSTFAPLFRIVKDSIKLTFPYAILMFCMLYLIFSYRKKTSRVFLSGWRYVSVFSIYTILLNMFFFSRGRDILIPLNLSVFYLAILIPVCYFLSKYVNIDNEENLIILEEWLPPVFYRFLNNNFQEKPLASSIAVFIVLLVMCAFLLILRAERAAEQLANIAYLLLVIGAGREVYLFTEFKK